MELKMYENDLDLTLLIQMRKLIIKGAGKIPPNYNDRKLFIDCPSISMKEQYGFCYPGEVLERYAERCGGGINQIRALAFALAEDKELLKKEMFIGQQYSNFLYQVRHYENQDIYLNCALYLLSEQERELDDLYHKIISYNYKSTEEVLVAVYTLRERPDAWEWKRNNLIRFFGKERTVKVYENEQAYKCVIKTFYKEITNEKKRNGRLLRGLFLLASKNVKNGSPEWRMFRENGYTEQEIQYLNLYLSRDVFDRRIPRLSIIVKRRIAFYYCRDILNAEIIESGNLIVMCEELLKKYQYYDGTMDGKSGIIDNLEYVVNVKNIEVFQLLYSLAETNYKIKAWLLVNLNDDKWDALSEWMKIGEYQKLFGWSLIMYGKDEIEIWLNRYFSLRGEDYMNVFWWDNDYTLVPIMKFFVEHNKFDLVATLKQYVEDEKVKTKEELNKKWHYMIKNIGDVAQEITCHDIFLFYEFFDRHYGISERKPFFKSCSRHPILKQSLIYEYGVLKELDLKEDILSEDERRVLFNWIEHLVYKEEPKKYDKFLYGCLMQKDFRDLFPEESQKIFAMIIDTLKDGSDEKNILLCEIYSEQEWKSYKEAENLRIEEENRRKRERKLEKYKDTLYQQIGMSKEPKEQFMLLVSCYPGVNDNKDELEVWNKVFLEAKGKKLWQVNKSDADEFMYQLWISLRVNKITWDVVLEMLKSIEPVTADETEETA